MVVVTQGHKSDKYVVWLAASVGATPGKKPGNPQLSRLLVNGPRGGLEGVSGAESIVFIA